MNKTDKIKLIEEIMELEAGTLNEKSVLSDYDEWDSLTIISYIALVDSRFNKNISVEKVRQFVTVEDAIKAI